jgi:hypothetical protein
MYFMCNVNEFIFSSCIFRLQITWFQVNMMLSLELNLRFVPQSNQPGHAPTRRSKIVRAPTKRLREHC